MDQHDSQLSALPDSPEASDEESTPAGKREKWTSDDEEFVITSDEDEDEEEDVQDEDYDDDDIIDLNDMLLVC